MGGLFGGGSPQIIEVPTLPPVDQTNNVADVAAAQAAQDVPPPPSIDDAQVEVEARREERTRKGRRDTVKVDEEEEVMTAARALTGN